MMDDSQSSDIFPEINTSLQNDVLTDIDLESYNLLVTKIKSTATKNDNGEDTAIFENFKGFLEDCGKCICQSFDIIFNVLEDSDTQICHVCGLIQDVVCVLQVLSNYIKIIIESTPLTCHSMKTFPVSTGNILLTVFTHCRDSESMYGDHISQIEKELKELFRNCHELQLTYLMTLEKYLLFDLTEKDDQNILVECLDINLKIGEVVQALDVKTMAEQWKAYSSICEKYSNFLVDKNIYNDCTKLLASLIETNIKTALEVDEQDKMVLRSLKVASFSLKILVKISNIFKFVVTHNYQHLVDIFTYIHLCCSSYHELIVGKVEFSNLVNGHLIPPLKILINHLVDDDNFLNAIFSREINDDRDPRLLGYVLLLTSIVKILLIKQQVQIRNKVISCIFSLLHKCHIWFNIGLKIKCSTNNRTYGLYEYLLIHVLAFSMTLNTEQYNHLEKHLYECILGTDLYCAAFACNLWVSICRMVKQIQLNVLTGLIRTYQKLALQRLFTISPQQTNLKFTIENLFKNLTDPEKIIIYRQFKIQDDNNIELWSALKIRNLPENLELTTEKMAVEKLHIISKNLVKECEFNVLENLVAIVNLAATCSFVQEHSRVEEFLLYGWKKACPTCNRNLITNSVSYLRYIQSLASLTHSYEERFQRSTSLLTIHKILTNILQTGNIEHLIIVFKVYCHLSLFLMETEHYGTTMDSFITTLRALSLKNDEVILQHTFNIFSSTIDLDNMASQALNDSNLSDFSNSYINYKKRQSDATWLKKLESAASNQFVHKCVENLSAELKVDITRTQSNFELIDEDCLFDFDSDNDQQPVSKKAKLEIDVEKLITDLENNVSDICQIKENILNSVYEERVKHACNKLRNIVS